MSYLRSKKCIPCEGDFPAMTLAQARDMMGLIAGWMLAEDAKEISRIFMFKDFAGAMALANRVADLAEEEGHHPDLQVSWGKLGIRLSTHSVKGLSENDFILAAKINALTEE